MSYECPAHRSLHVSNPSLQSATLSFDCEPEVNAPLGTERESTVQRMSIHCRALSATPRALPATVRGNHSSAQDKALLRTCGRAN